MKLVVCVCAVALLLPLVASAGPMKPGKWQMTTETEIEGTPSTMPQMTTRCISAEEADKLEPPRSMKNSADCKIGDYNVNGRVVTWSVKCSRRNVTGGGKIMYNDDTYSGRLTMKLGKGEMVQTFTGKLLGECDAKK